ncbi:MAG TPA: divergent PAP2 family protein [Ardenticatenaceae bacterium]
MQLLGALLRNQPLVIANLAWLVAQALKVLTHYAYTRRVDFRMWASSGGLPSSHSAFVTALTTAIGLQEGFDSALFAACFVFGSIVMFDARGVRMAAGHQARVLNQIVRELFEGHPISQEKFKELLGHTNFQVIAGALLGIVMAVWWMGGVVG